MPLVIGHSQTKYLLDYLSVGDYSVFSYSGYRTLKFLQEEALFDVTPYFSAIVLVVGANDIDVKSPETIVDDILCLCDAIRSTSPSAIVFVSTVLPICQNRFEGCGKTESYISRWNDDACDVNNRLRGVAYEHAWIRVVEHPQFYTLFDLKAFERRLTEVIDKLQPTARLWRIILIIVSICTSVGAWTWLWDPYTSQVTFTQSLWNHPFFTLSCMILVTLLLCGIHKRVIAPSIIASRCRKVLAEYNMSCDETGKLILKPRPST